MAIHSLRIFALAAVIGDGHVVQMLDTGGLVYVFIALMALTSNDVAMRLLGVRWGRLHIVAIHVMRLSSWTFLSASPLSAGFDSIHPGMDWVNRWATIRDSPMSMTVCAV